MNLINLKQITLCYKLSKMCNIILCYNSFYSFTCIVCKNPYSFWILHFYNLDLAKALYRALLVPDFGFLILFMDYLVLFVVFLVLGIVRYVPFAFFILVFIMFNSA